MADLIDYAIEFLLPDVEIINGDGFVFSTSAPIKERAQKRWNTRTLDKLMTRLGNDYGNSAAWKIAALFFGVVDTTNVTDPLNPYKGKRAGYSAARNILIYGNPAKIPTQESMIGAKFSPLIYDGQRITNTLSGKSIQANDYNGKLPNEIKNLLPTLSGAVGVMTFPGCYLFDTGKQCSFCTAGKAEGKKPITDMIISELEILIQSGFPAKNLVINTGQLKEPGKDLKVVGYVARVAREKFPEINIAAEIGPFSLIPRIADGTLETYLKETGLSNVDTFMVNVELVTDDARRRMCPAKPDKDSYKAIIKRLSQLGYQVTTVIQLNFELEPIENIAWFVNDITRYGPGKVVPELLLSRAVPGSNVDEPYWKKLSVERDTVYQQQLMIERFDLVVARLDYIRKNIKIDTINPGYIKAGCVACGQCNLNPELSKVV